MDETLWELFWATGLPEAYALAKEAGQVDKSEQSTQKVGEALGGLWPPQP